MNFGLRFVRTDDGGFRSFEEFFVLEAECIA